MKIFEDQKNERGWGSKTNFVDDRNVVVGYDMEQDCCEHAGWFMAPNKPDACDPDTESKQPDDTEPYRFDPEFFEKLPSAKSGTYPALDSGAAVLFRLVADGLPDWWLVLFNAHNGYYGHGFTVTIGGVETRSDSL
jgi:hypothetical protein